MVEIILIVLCVIAAKRFKAAGEKGVGKYIAGIWVAVLGGALFGVLIAASVGIAGMIVFAIGYGIAIIIAISAMRTGKTLMDNAVSYRAAQEAEAKKKMNHSTSSKSNASHPAQSAEENRNAAVPKGIHSPSGLKKVTIFMGHSAAGQLVVNAMNADEIDMMLSKLGDPSLAQRIRLFAKDNTIKQEMLKTQVPRIASQEDFASFVNRTFPVHMRPPYADVGVVVSSIIFYFVVAEIE